MYELLAIAFAACLILGCDPIPKWIDKAWAKLRKRRRDL